MTVQYQGVWTLQSAAQLQSTQRWVTDPLFENTTLLLQADDAANGAQNNTFLDSSSNSFAITRNGNTTQGTFTPFSSQPGAWSNFFLTSDNYFGVAGNAAFSFTANFTVECFVYQVARSDNGVVTEISSYLDGVMIRLGTIGSIYDTVYVNGTNVASISSVVPLNVWTHIAVVRSGSTVTVYVNGISRGTATVAGTVNTTSGAVRIAAPLHTTPGTQPFQGYISNFRILKGTAQYTSNFTPPTAPLTNITNTSLLTCQSNQFIDNSTANSGSGFTITTVGTPSVQPFSPFAPQFQWTPSVIGGSGYFDGTGDFLTWPSGSSVAFGTGDFTVEAFVYLSSAPGQQYIIDARDASNTATWAFAFGLSGAANGKFGFFDGATLLEEASASVTANAFAHLVAVRSGTTLSIFVNRNRVATVTNSRNISSAPGTSYIGNRYTGAGYLLTGYLSGVRIVKGTAVYDPTQSTLTIPTAPLTAITNTQLLLNFTNAGIYDATMKNNLETVGNAQVSTAVVKYGSGSMFFDGSGDYLTSYNVGGLFRLGTVYTVEMWFYATSVAAGTAGLINFATTVSGNVGFNLYRSSAEIVCNDGAIGGTGPSSGAGSVVANVWTHLAVVSNGVTTKVYLDGVERGSFTGTTGSANTMLYVTIGSFNDKSSTFSGYIDDLRVTRGIARYTQNFIPPSVALPRQ